MAPSSLPFCGTLLTSLCRLSEKRKDPLVKACGKMSIKTPKSATLACLREDLVKYWCASHSLFYKYTLIVILGRFPSPVAADAPTRHGRTPAALIPFPGPSASRSTHAHDMLSSVLAPEGQVVVIPQPSGSIQHPQPSTSSGSSHGEFRGAVPPFSSNLTHIIPGQP
jgi:predicted dienelactone hydrolase